MPSNLEIALKGLNPLNERRAFKFPPPLSHKDDKEIYNNTNRKIRLVGYVG